jgi:hypothetical protein
VLHFIVEFVMKENLEKVKLLARDLRNGKEFPRSPREALAGYVLTARAVDKCRAVLGDAFMTVPLRGEKKESMKATYKNDPLRTRRFGMKLWLEERHHLQHIQQYRKETP